MSEFSIGYLSGLGPHAPLVEFGMLAIIHKDLAQLTLTKRPFSRLGWIFEMKYDGFRALGAHDDTGPRLVTRKGNDLLANFPEIGISLKALPPIVLDGELVILDDKGLPQFDRLSR